MLKINTNISAMQSQYYLQMNENSFNTSLQRLSSGLKINSAADDPAGLVISQKYDAEVQGLSQAVSNAKDGIGMVQTAEGAMDEMTSLLKNMRNLALSAANTAVNDTTSLQTDQDQINSMISSFDRIADTTKFGSKNLLDGSLGLTATTGSSNLQFVGGTDATKAGKYTVSINSAASQGYVMSNAYVKASIAAVTTNAASNAASDATAQTITFSGDLVTAKLGASYAVNIAASASFSQVLASLQADTTLSNLGLTIGTNSSGNLAIYDSKYVGQVSVAASGSSLAALMGIGSTTATGGTATLTSAELGSFKTASAETLTFQDTSSGLSKQVTIASDTYLNAITSSLNTQFTNLGVNISTSFAGSTNVAGGQALKFTSTAYGDNTAVSLTMGHNVSGTAGLSLGFTTGTQYNVAQGGAVTNGNGANGANVAGTIDGTTATGSGRTLTSNSGNSSGLSLLYTGTAAASNVAVTVNGGANLVFQVGAFQNQTVTTSINDMHTSRMGLAAQGSSNTTSVANIDVRTQAGAQDALAVLDKAISDVSAVRGKLGSFQADVLQSTVRNLGVAKQNLASSKSNITDADMATEMLNFSRAQILNQTGMAMLAQANQAPNQIMSLFR